jgi:serine/threonine protein kinase
MILNHPTVTKQVDMWSVGCILAELIGRKPLFPGSSPLDQLKRICQICGTPNFKDVPGDKKTVQVMFSNLSFYNPIDFKLIYPNTSLETLDLLSKMLQFQPNKRISAEESLKHPYFKSLYSKDHLENCEIFDNSFEKLTQSYGIKSVMYESLLEYGKKSQKFLFFSKFDL